MTRKDYVMLSDTLRSCKPFTSCNTAAHGQHRLDCISIANSIRDNDPKFDRERFLRDCGVHNYE